MNLKGVLAYNLGEVVANYLSDSFDDKLFLYAKDITTDVSGFHLTLDLSDCIVFLNERTKDAFVGELIARGLDPKHFQKSPVINDIRSGSHSGYLFSAGAIVQSYNDSFIMIERDDKAPTEAGCWQFPGGRGDTTDTVELALRELSEEVEITRDDQKLSVGDLEVLKNIPGELRIRISVAQGGQIFTYENRALAFYDERNHTLEQYVRLRLPSMNSHISLRDREYDRRVDLIDVEDLSYGDMNFVRIIEKHKADFIELMLESMEHGMSP